MGTSTDSTAQPKEQKEQAPERCHPGQLSSRRERLGPSSQCCLETFRGFGRNGEKEHMSEAWEGSGS